MANQTKVIKLWSANTGSANTFSWSGGFEIFKSTEVEVYLDDLRLTYTATTIDESASPREYSVDIAAKTVHIGGVDLTSGAILLKANTDVSNARAVYQGGSSVSSGDLNANQDQLLRKLSEKDASEETSFTTGATAPSNPEDGDVWYDSIDGRTYIYYVDIDSGQWVDASPPFDSDGDRAFTQLGTGAVARTWDSKLQETISVTDFGAVGDGVANDTTNIQAALNAAEGKTLLIPKGIYLVSSTLIIKEGTRIIGSGKSDLWDEDYTKGTVLQTTGSGNAQVWTDIAAGTDSTQTPCLVAGGNGIYVENLTIYTASNNWSIGLFFPCVKQCGFKKISVRGFTNACIYLDATWSNLNTTLTGSTLSGELASNLIKTSTGMNEFYGEDFYARGNTGGLTDYGIKIQGSTRNPDSYNDPDAISNPWVWGWGGASDVVFNKGRTDGIKLDGAIKNAAKAIQGIRFIAVDSRIASNSSGEGKMIDIDRANRVDFISGYGEVYTNGHTGRIDFTGNTGFVNFSFSDYNANVFLTPTAWSASVEYTTGQRILANSKIYEAQATISSGGSEPSHGSGTTANWKFIVASGTTLGALGTIYVNEKITCFTERGEFVTANGLLNDNDVLRPVVDGGINLGSDSYNFANVKTKKVSVFNGTDEGSISFDTNFVIDGRANETGLQFRASDIIPRDNGSKVDDAIDLGDASYRFDDVFATNGTIQTSDENEKQDIRNATDAEKKVAVAIKSLFKIFKFKSAVTAKGDNARLHFGVLAQNVETAFKNEGLDPEKYALFCKDTWTDETTKKEVTRLGIRYSELLAFVISSL